MRQPSNNCAILIETCEGCVLKAYFDPNGVPTIGIGHTEGVTADDVKNGRTITKEQAYQLLFQDMTIATADVNNMVKTPLTQNQFDALVCFVFNIGGSQFLTSTMLRLLNQGQYLLAAQQFPRWNKQNGQILPGLVKRRLLEQKLFMTP